MNDTLRKAMAALVAVVLAYVTWNCSGNRHHATDGQDDATAAAADTLTDFEDPTIDESTLIVENDSMNFDPSELSIPPRRFFSKQKALEYMQNSEDWERYRTGILPRMLEENLPYADRLLNSEYEYFIVADKQSMHVVLFDRFGNRVKSYPMAAARNFGSKHRKRDSRTPEGFFYAHGVYDSTDWLFTDDDGVTSEVKGQYGPRFIRVTNMIGIHGTRSPRSLGKRVSHGCMRLSNDDIMDLVQYVKTGMPIIVNPSDRDVAVNRAEGYDIAQINVGLDAADGSRNFNAAIADNYPARPERADTSRVVPDSIMLMAEMPDSAAIITEAEKIVNHPDSIAH